MNPEQLEDIYESLALKIDDVGKAHSELFLAKLALLLAHSVGDVDLVKQYINDASKDLFAEP